MTSCPTTISTKILATVGPACDSEPSLRRLIAAGVNVFRLNFSHGSLDHHRAVLQTIRRVSGDLKTPVAVLGDLCGPKIRLGEVDETAGGMALAPGDSLTIQRAPVTGDAGRASVNYDRFVDEVEPGHRVLIDDGAVRFIAVEKTADSITCSCTAGGVIKSRKGVNLPDTVLSISSITDHDRTCVRFAIENDLDYLALSFVRRADELCELRAMLQEAKADIHLVAKIEKPQAVANIGPILDASDAIMIARGDLGVEMDLAKVPLIQKQLIEACRSSAKPVIVATQMLQSMIESSTPTRAEVSDVANAILDGADAVMLSGETAMGKNPEAAVRTMRHIARETELYIHANAATRGRVMPEIHTREQDAALARGAWQIADCLHVKLVVVVSGGGANARIFSKLRLPVPVVALTPFPRTTRRLALYHGLSSHTMEVAHDLDLLLPRVDSLLTEHGYVQPGDSILIVGALTVTSPPQSNAIMVHRIKA